jgi:hypothetical protein
MIFHISIRKTFRFLLVALIGLILLGKNAIAEDKKLKEAFQKLAVVQQYKNSSESNCIPNNSWRIVQAENRKSAMGSSNIIVAGTINAKGEAPLTKEKREALYDATQESQQPMWFICYPELMQLVINQKNGRHIINLVELKEEAAVPLTPSPEKQVINPSIYTQTGFDAPVYLSDFTNWRLRLKQDLDEFRTQMRNDQEYGRTLLQESNTNELEKIFSRSLHNGPKGLSLRKLFIEAAYSRDRRVNPAGANVIRLLLADEAKPVGFGGGFTDDGNTVELWYMLFDDLSSWTTDDIKESLIYSAFTPLELPPNKVTQRNSWPALVFIRNGDNSVSLYGLSAELVLIIQRIFNAQIG